MAEIHRKTWNIIPCLQKDRYFSQTIFNDADQEIADEYEV